MSKLLFRIVNGTVLRWQNRPDGEPEGYCPVCKADDVIEPNDPSISVGGTNIILEQVGCECCGARFVDVWEN
jgi:C4-type Zn-finger protein